MISSNEPTSEDVRAVLTRIAVPEHAAYFFSRATNPAWIRLLTPHGVFSSPQQSSACEADNKYIFWPQSKFLVRMASAAPSEVATIFQSLDTVYPFIWHDAVDAALSMPPKIAARLVRKLSDVFGQNDVWPNMDRASNLCAKLVAEGEFSAGISLARALFSRDSFREGRRQLDAYWYQKGLERLLPSLVRQDAKTSLYDACTWLGTAVEIENTEYIKPGSEQDFSSTWRETVEGHTENERHNLPSAVTVIVRDAFEQAIHERLISLNEALTILGKEKYSIFKRLQLHLINQFAELDAPLARSAMMNLEEFTDRRLVHEYAMLIGARFPLLEASEQARWLGRVDAGPGDRKSFDEFELWWNKKSPSDEDWRRHVELWKLAKLYWVRAHLSGDYREQYEGLAAKYGEPQMADRSFRMRGFSGTRSPITVEELQKLTFEEAVNTVCAWKKPEKEEFGGPSHEGLGDVFGQYVATNPEDSSRKADILKGRYALYVRHFIQRMAAAAQAGKNIDLKAVLDLCLWVKDQRGSENVGPVEAPEYLVDRDWQWTRDSICELITKICTAQVDDRPRYPRNGIEAQMAALLDDLTRGGTKSNLIDKKPEIDARAHDFLTSAINSPRGRAVSALMEYARWITGHSRQKQGEEEIVPDGMDSMPKVREMIEWQIENPSFMSNSVIGTRLGSLYWIDKQWLKEKVGSVFDLADGKGPGWAAWNGFVVWQQPHIEFFHLLESQYEQAVQESGKVELEDKSRSQPMYRLGEHLVVLYARGQLPFEEDGIFKRFLNTAIPAIRSHAITFVGSSLYGVKDPKTALQSDVVKRFQDLWDWYWPRFKEIDAKLESEPNLFGAWFAAGVFDDLWSLQRLDEFTQVISKPEPDSMVADQLAEKRSANLGLALEILDRIIRNDNEGRLFGWKDPAKQILEDAVKNTDLRPQAESLLDYLGRAGYVHDFEPIWRIAHP